MGAHAGPAVGIAAHVRTMPRWLALGAGLLLADNLLLLAHILHYGTRWMAPDRGWLPWVGASWWNGGRDGSVLELFGQLQLVVAAVLLVMVAARRAGHSVLAIWGVVLLFMAADDLLRLHERVGWFLGQAQMYSLINENGARELGGLAFWVLAALVLGTSLLVTHRRSCVSARRASAALLGTMTPLAAVIVGYVVITALLPELLHGIGGVVIVFVRVLMKLWTMTLVLVLVLRFIRRPSTGCPTHATSTALDPGSAPGCPSLTVSCHGTIRPPRSGRPDLSPH